MAHRQADRHPDRWRESRERERKRDRYIIQRADEAVDSADVNRTHTDISIYLCIRLFECVSTCVGGLYQAGRFHNSVQQSGIETSFCF